MKKKYKIEYGHSAVPNFIPNADKYIKIYDTLEIEEDFRLEQFEGKIKVNHISENPDILYLLEYIVKCNWEIISKKEYKSNDLDGTNWYFYIEYENNKYIITGYEEIPEEINNIVCILKVLSEKYLDEIKTNKIDIEVINKNKKSNISFMKFLKNKGIINDKELQNFKNRHKKYE